jgi:hypothetical protein
LNDVSGHLLYEAAPSCLLDPDEDGYIKAHSAYGRSLVYDWEKDSGLIFISLGSSQAPSEWIIAKNGTSYQPKDKDFSDKSFIDSPGAFRGMGYNTIIPTGAGRSLGLRATGPARLFRAFLTSVMRRSHPSARSRFWLRSASRDAKQYLASLEQKERVRTSIKSLKVGYNKVFGYYIEVSKPNLASVPTEYIRKQTLTEAETVQGRSGAFGGGQPRSFDKIAHAALSLGWVTGLEWWSTPAPEKTEAG